MRVLTSGKTDYNSVKTALNVLDTEEESLFKSGGKSSYFLEELEVSQFEEVPESEKDEHKLIYFAIEEQNFTGEHGLLGRMAES